MTFDPDNPIAGLPGADTEPIEEMPVEAPRRAASVTLRGDDVRQSRAASMEAANKSLRDALRITYRLVQAAMIVLVGLFLFSGFQQVNQSESGIRVEFGQVKAEKLDPGFQFSLPAPLGKIIKVSTGSQSFEMDDKFWPEMSAEERRRPIDQMGRYVDRLNPGKDGSLLTADSNIAHAQFSVIYTRSRPADYIKNIYTPHELAMVRSAVQRAAVRVAASVSIDEFLKPGGAADGGGRGENSVESRIRSLAQESLDTIDAGIEINQVLIRSATPPILIRKDFNNVQTAQSNAGKAREQALGDRSRILNEAAGSGHQLLLDLIDEYELALDLGDDARETSALDLLTQALDGALNGKTIDALGRTYENVNVSGEVSQMIGRAEQYRQTIAQQAQREAETFRTMLKQYEANPKVFVAGSLADALKSFYANPAVTQFWIPDATEPFDLIISRDPEIAREAERQIKTQQVEENPRVKKMREFLDD